jgi:signal transduction histidine kinase
MVNPLTGLAGEEERRASAIKVISLGFIGASLLGIVSTLIIFAFNRDYPMIPVVSISLVGAVTSWLTYRLASTGRVKYAGYIFVAVSLAEAAFITSTIGGFAGPMAVIYLMPILIAGMVIRLRSSFLAAVLSTILYLAMIPLEHSGFLPVLVAPVPQDGFIPIMHAGVMIIFFYVVAFLSWFAVSRLNRALETAHSYAGKLLEANEKLQASEEELRAANEELVNTNEELRATEEELRASNEELMAANDELRDAQERLVRSEKLAAIGQLAGGVGHELRNPLGAIKNAVYYIRGKIAGSEVARKEPRIMDFLDIVDDEISSSNKIINDLLGFSRVGKPALSPARIEKVIEEAINHVPLPENIGLEKEIKGSLPDIKIDTEQIRQVLVNIITNAAQAMPDGGRITVGMEVVDGHVDIKIADTGIGIPENVLGKIFDPLFTMKAKGIGLGLAVCKSIVERHQGSIGVASQVGKGTTFTVSLPLQA